MPVRPTATPPRQKGLLAPLRRILLVSWTLPLVVTLLCVALASGLAFLVAEKEQSDLESVQAREIALITAELRNRLRSHAQFLRGLRAFFSVTPHLSPADWQSYTRRLELESHISGMTTYGFAPRVASNDHAAFIASIRRLHGLPDFAIRPAPAHDPSFVILHTAPASESAAKAVGLDLFAESKRRRAVEQARDTDDLALTGRITLRNDQEAQPQPALLMLMPVYRPGSVPYTVSDRRREIVGAVYSAYRINDLMASLNFVRDASVNLRVFDDEAFNSEKEGQGLTLLFDLFSTDEAQPQPIQEAEIEFGQRKWVLQFQPKAGLPLFSNANALFLGGLFLSILLGLLTWNLTTRRQQAEATARTMNAELQTLVDHIPGGVSLIDDNLRFSAMNRHLLTILDLPEQLFAAGAPTLYEVLLFNAQRGEYGPGDPKTLALQGVEQARHPVAHLFERTRPNGSTIEVRGAPLPDGGIVTIYTDISERKRAEAELRRHRDHLAELVAEQTADLRRAKDDAELSSQAKSEFLTNMSHELRTPLHAILSFAALGEDKANDKASEKANDKANDKAHERHEEKPSDNKLAHYFSRIRESANRLLVLIDDLLDLAKLEAGKTHIEPRVFDVLMVIREVVAELDPLLSRRKLRITLQDAPCSTLAMCDPPRFAQVIRNLLGNAIKFSPEHGQIALSFGQGLVPGGRRSNDSAQPALSITISDEGIGIPPDELETIFDKFTQSSKTRTGAGGTGLGLSICREIVRAHHGAIVACNNPQHGASFIIHLPIAPKSAHGPAQRDDL
jgi:signal transduction histidine kinase/sensor domain CHASE-containing protein